METSRFTTTARGTGEVDGFRVRRAKGARAARVPRRLTGFDRPNRSTTRIASFGSGAQVRRCESRGRCGRRPGISS